LNMDYTPPLDLKQDEVKMYFQCSASILDNSLTRFLKLQNYDIRQYQPVSFGNKDWPGEYFFKKLITRNYLYKTLPGRMYRDLGWQYNNLLQNYFPNYTFSAIAEKNKKHQHELVLTKELIKNTCSLQKVKPHFIYAHFQLPHEPYIYDSTGHLKPAKKTVGYNEHEKAEAFMEQVKYANKTIYELVTHIRKFNKKNTIIYITGDHGYRNINGTRPYMIFDNYSAYYFPDNKYENLYNGISPVNSFRVILNKHFQTNITLLKDSSIFIPYTLPKN
jgi:hypothetical protein